MNLSFSTIRIIFDRLLERVAKRRILSGTEKAAVSVTATFDLLIGLSLPTE